MDEQAKGRPKIRRKLNKKQIGEILERNVALYKDDEAFVHYLVDLAIYLMEYEYDWGESGQMPEALRAKTGDSDTQPDHQSPLHPTTMPSPSSAKGEKACPFCGATVGDVLICPTCRNLTR